MSELRNSTVEEYKKFPTHFKMGVRNDWASSVGLSKRSLDGRLNGTTPFTPKELNEFIRIVEEYQTCLADQQADQEETDPIPVQA